MRRDVGEHGIKFVGERFNGGRLPVSMLPDLMAYEAMAIGFLSEIWTEEHPDEPLMPRGMAEGVSYALVSISDGSAKAVAVASYDEDDQISLDESGVTRRELVEKSGDRVVEFWAKASNGELRAFLPRKVYSAVERFHKSLKNKNEQIVLFKPEQKPANDNGEIVEEHDLVVIDADLCQRILAHAKPVDSVRISGIGKISGVGFGKHQTRLKITEVDEWLKDRGSISLKVDNERFSSSLHQYAAPGAGYVYYDVVVIPKENGSPDVEREIELEGISEHDWNSLERRQAIARSFSAYPDDWDDEGAEAIADAAVRTAVSVIRRRPCMADRLMPLPRWDGGIGFEFTTNDRWSWSLRVMSDGSMKLFGVDLDSDAATYHLKFTSGEVGEVADVLDDIVRSGLRIFESDPTSMRKDWSVQK